MAWAWLCVGLTTRKESRSLLVKHDLIAPSARKEKIRKEKMDIRGRLSGGAAEAGPGPNA